MTTKEDLVEIVMLPSNHNHKGSMNNNNNKLQSKANLKAKQALNPTFFHKNDKFFKAKKNHEGKKNL
jgi:hypothetical protein